MPVMTTPAPAAINAGTRRDRRGGAETTSTAAAPSPPVAATAAASSFENAQQDGNRTAGSLLRAFASTPDSPPGNAGFSLSAGSGSLNNTCARMLSADSPLNGYCPVSMRYATTASEY